MPRYRRITSYDSAGGFMEFTADNDAEALEQANQGLYGARLVELSESIDPTHARIIVPAPEPVIEEHAFVPGDGEFTREDTCQFTGCGHYLSEHEEGEPCCYPAFSTRGQHHAYDCPEERS